MMAQKTLVMLREAQGMRDAKSEVAKLEAYFAHPTDTTVFVLTWKGDPFKSTNALVKAALKNGGVIFESQKPKDWQLDTLISDYCSSKQISIDHKSVELLKDSIGNDLKRLYSEIDKLLIATSGAPITPEVIERNIGISRDFNNFELTRALSVRDYNKAMQIVNYFERNPKQNPAIVTAALLFTFFSNLMLAHYAPDKSDKGLMTQLKFHTSYQLTDVKPALKRYSALSCMRIIHAIRDYDRKSKGVGSLQKEFPLLKELIYKIFTL
jgi:DNA polymerase-3 subunit delta